MVRLKFDLESPNNYPTTKPQQNITQKILFHAQVFITTHQLRDF